MTTDARTEQALEVAKRIAAKEAELAELRREFASYLAGTAKQSRAQDAKVAAHAPPLASTPERVLEVLRRESVGRFTPADLTKRLPDVNVKLLRNSCVRLAQKGRLQKLKRGLYQLPQEADTN